MSERYCGRLAPSPTGAQHLGNARSYLIAWLRARSVGGSLILRIEDIDSPRTKPGAAQQALEDLEWLGLDYEEGPIVQTERLSLYQAAFECLKRSEEVFPCICSRRDVEEAASAPHEGPGQREPCYPGTCSARSVSDAGLLDRKPYCWRYRSPNEVVRFQDVLQGPQSVSYEERGGDFVVWKSADAPAYQLAVVVDDADQGITEVVRGDDLIPSTARQILLYQALGLTPPSFFHVPLVVGADGRRLAKRHGDTRLAALREQGIAPEAVLGLLAWSCQWLPTLQPIRARELLSLFRPEAIPLSPFVLTAEMLSQIGYSP